MEDNNGWNMSRPIRADTDERDSDRKFIILAILAGLIICGGIVAYFYWQNLRGGRGADYAAPRVIPVEPSTPPATPPPAPAPKETKEPPKLAPPRPEIDKAATKGPTPAFPHTLAPPDFVYKPIPHDAPLAEFPIMLVWQKRREWYRPPGGGELPISPPPFSVVPKPPRVPPTVPPTIPPTEQSPSGL